MGLSERKNIRRAYGFDEVAIVPGSITINPEITDTSICYGCYSFPKFLSINE